MQQKEINHQGTQQPPLFRTSHAHSTTLYRICKLLNNVTFLMRNYIFQNIVMFHDLLYFIANSACSTHSYTYKTIFPTISHLKKMYGNHLCTSLKIAKCSFSQIFRCKMVRKDGVTNHFRLRATKILGLVYNTQ